MTRLVDTHESAKDMFETFHAKGSRRQVKFGFNWPRQMQEVGRAVAQLYRSNKWKMNPREFEDYKHIAEAPQRLYVVPGFLQDAEQGGPLKVYGPKVSLDGEMPKHFSILATLIGVQARLYDQGGKLPRGESGLFEIVVKHGMLGGARFPDNDEPFLFVYTKQGGVHMMITGTQLDIEKDGIVG